MSDGPWEKRIWETLNNEDGSGGITYTDYHDEVALGLRTGKSLWHKWGYNEDVDTAAPEVVWSEGGEILHFLPLALP